MSRCDPVAFHELLAGRATLPSLTHAQAHANASAGGVVEPLQTARANAEQRVARQLEIASELFACTPTVEDSIKLLQYGNKPLAVSF